MADVETQSLVIEAGKSTSVSALLTRPKQTRACFVFAHGAGAGFQKFGDRVEVDAADQVFA